MSVGNSSLRQLRENSDTYSGEIRENTWRAQLTGSPVEPRWGHGRIEIGSDGLPTALVWGMVDDFLVHAPTRNKCFKAFSEFMDHSVRYARKSRLAHPPKRRNFVGCSMTLQRFPVCGLCKLRFPGALLLSNMRFGRADEEICPV